MEVKYKFIILFITGLLLEACEIPYNVPVEQSEKQYVIDGLITDNPGPYIIKLNYSAAYTVKSEGSIFPVERAEVSIIDTSNQDQPIILTGIGGGKYQTDPSFVGIPDHVYILHIITLNGDELMSFPEQLPPLSPIVDTHYEFVQETAFHPQGDRVWITMADIPNVRNYYRWKFEGVYRFTTFLDHLPFSTICWQYEYYYFNILLASDRYFDGQQFDKDITVIPYFDGSPYLVTIFSQSLTEQAYKFWNLVDQQVNNSSGIFGSPPYHIKGNMYCVNKPENEVLGYFGASSIRKSHVFIVRADEGPVKNKRLYDFNRYCNTYRNAVPYTGNPNDDPEGWQH